MWLVSSTSDPARWVRSENGVITGDAESQREMKAFAGQSVSRGPMSGTYTPTSAGDPVGLFLLACSVVPGPQAVTGSPPAVPELPAGKVPPGAVH